MGAVNDLRDKVVARLCREAGGEALAVRTDVTDEAAVQHLAAEALLPTGRIDVRVNNAGVTAFGMFDEIPFDEHRRVFETNAYGVMYGARAALPIFKRQRAGSLIKFAVRGLSETLRTALDAHALAPEQPVEKVARALVSLAEPAAAAARSTCAVMRQHARFCDAAVRGMVRSPW